MKVTGYVVGIHREPEERFASVQIAELANARQTHRSGKMTLTRTEAIAGVQKLLDYFGGFENFTLHAGATKLIFDIDDAGGLIRSFTAAEEN